MKQRVQITSQPLVRGPGRLPGRLYTVTILDEALLPAAPFGRTPAGEPLRTSTCTTMPQARSLVKRATRASR